MKQADKSETCQFKVVVLKVCYKNPWRILKTFHRRVSKVKTIFTILRHSCPSHSYSLMMYSGVSWRLHDMCYHNRLNKAAEIRILFSYIQSDINESCKNIGQYHSLIIYCCFGKIVIFHKSTLCYHRFIFKLNQ